MKTEIDVRKYSHVDKIFWGNELVSVYNHNYYYSEELGDVILEECDEFEDYFKYYRLDGYSTKFLGGYYGIGGIFKDEDGVVELNNENWT